MPPVSSKTTNHARLAAAALPVTNFMSHREYLHAVYEATKAASQAYSYLTFAAELGFSATNVMRLVIAGKRPLTNKAAGKIATSLGLTGTERRYWTTLVAYANARLPAEREELFRQLIAYKTKAQPAELNPLQAAYFSEWFHPVIREMTGLADFNGEPEWIKARLVFPLRLDEIKRSLELLTKLGFLRKVPGGKGYVRAVRTVSTEAEIDSMAIVRYHQKMIEIGRESITIVPEENRDIRAVTVSLPSSAMPLLKGKIEEWISEIAAMEGDGGDGDEVVQVNVQMFPFTKKTGGAS